MGEVGASARRIVIALDQDASEPSGHLEIEGKPGWPFTGWLGLLTALQSVTETRPDPAAGARPGDAPE